MAIGGAQAVDDKAIVNCEIKLSQHVFIAHCNDCKMRCLSCLSPGVKTACDSVSPVVPFDDVCYRSWGGVTQSLSRSPNVLPLRPCETGEHKRPYKQAFRPSRI